tara:strand:- start:1208 stop:1912 length:705 start_codon:yes stop_codon:yes gene_type:complete
MKILALLTGRGGSKLKNKNILKINGKPCLYYPCKASKSIKSIKYFFVSSDDINILKTAEKYGFKKIKRPKKLSRDNSQHIDVLKHALKVFRSKENFLPDYVLVLLANAPIINSRWIRDCLKIIQKNKEITSVVPVYEDNDHNPLRAKKIHKKYIKNFLNHKGNISSNRQELPRSYFLCHNFWIIKSSSIFKNNGEKPWSFMGKKIKPYIVNKTIDIHDYSDVILANYILKKKTK